MIYHSEEPKSIAPLTESWTRGSRDARFVDGIEWRSYRVGISRFAAVAEHPVLTMVTSNYGRSTYSLRIGGELIGGMFRSEERAMIAAAKELKITIREYQESEGK